MVLGILLIAAACACWGGVCIVPTIFPGFDNSGVLLGRYLVFGLVSLMFLVVQKRHLIDRKYALIWKKAFFLGTIATTVHYLGLLQSLGEETSSEISFLLGLSPITAALYGNWKERLCSYKKLFFPSLFMVAGLICIQTGGFSLKLNGFIGLAFGLMGLIVWTWYLVESDTYIRKQPLISIDDFVIVIGVAILCVTLILSLCFQREALFDKSHNFPLLLFGTFILCIFVSLLGGYLWKKGSRLVSDGIARHLSILQTIFYIVFMFAFDHRWPSKMEGIGLISIVIGIVLTPQIFKVSSLNEYSY